jgi:hypothetical protein
MLGAVLAMLAVLAAFALVAGSRGGRDPGLMGGKVLVSWPGSAEQSSEYLNKSEGLSTFPAVQWHPPHFVAQPFRPSDGDRTHAYRGAS